MPIQSLEFLSLTEAEAFIPNQATVAISMLSPGRQPAKLHASISNVLWLYYHDGVPPEGNQDSAELFSSEQACAVIEFLREHHNQLLPLHLLIHCEAGISRSTAVAVFAVSECRLPLCGQFAFLNPWVLTTLVKTAYPHYAFD